MAIRTTKAWRVACDSTSSDGLSDCMRIIVIHEGDPSEWAVSIWNRGDLQLHLRRLGWTVGKTVLCPNHRRA